MLQEAISAVSEKLAASFDCPVYTEPNRQGTKCPAFFVTADQYTSKALAAGRREERFTIEIQYLPPDAERRRADALAVGEKLDRLFACLSLPGGDVPCFHKKFGFRNLTRGFNRGYQITDEVLVFSFVVDFFSYEKPDGAMMEQYELQTDWKEENNEQR